MSGFKGTKGKWEVRPADHIGCTLVYFGDFKGEIECWHHHGDSMTSREANANALLISKAPEMLEMLESVVAMFDKGQVITEEKVINKRTEIEQLIKSATEL